MHSYLPCFHLDEKFTSYSAKQDKIDVSLGKWFIHFSDREDLEAFLSRLIAPPPLSSRTGKRRRVNENYGLMNGWLFRRSTIKSEQRYWNLNIRGGDQTLEGDNPTTIAPPVFGGRMHWQSSERDGRHWLEGTADLKLNPTRYFRHHPIVKNTLPAGLLESELGREKDVSEFSYHGDNWIKSSHRIHQSNYKRWENVLLRYLRLVEESLNQEISRALKVSGHDFENEAEFVRKISIKRAETYWDLFAPNPSALVKDLSDYVHSYGRIARQVNYINNDIELDEGMLSRRDENSLVIGTQLNIGEWLKIYAKTNRRIRIEVEHNLVAGSAKKMFQFPRKNGTRESSAHTFGTHQEAVQFLRGLADRTALVCEKFMNVLRRRARYRPSFNTAFDLLQSFAANSVGADEATSILELLVENSSLYLKGMPEALQKAIRRMAKAGILEYASQGQVYQVASNWKHALAALQEHVRAPLLFERTPRKPERNRLRPIRR